MKCDEKDETLGACARLDSALHQLGMLSAITDARHDYLRENRTDFGIMRMNTRFVSNVTVGYCMRRTLHRHRVFPYALPRHRTKSENSESKETDVRIEDASCAVELARDKTKSAIKRCQSLESLGQTDAASQTDIACQTDPTVPPVETHDLDGVSHRIEKLQVEE